MRGTRDTIRNLGLAAVLSLLLSFPVWFTSFNNALAEGATDAAVAALLEKAFDSDTLPVAGVRMPMQDYRSVYASLSWQPLWVDTNGLTERAHAMLAPIEAAGSDGLSPQTYNLPAIYALQNTHALAGKSDVRGLAAMDLLVSHAIVRYAHDLHKGATPASRKLLEGFTPTAFDATRTLEAAYVNGDSGAFLTSHAPQSSAYASLRTLLADYKTLAAQGGWAAFPIGRPLHPHDSDARIPTLRAILAAMKDFDGDMHSAVYDETLKEAVYRFQSRHGLNASGILNSATQKALAVPVEERIVQIEATLERMRWMPENLGDRYVLINLPAYELHAYDKGKEALSMRVIVGKTLTRTPQFSDIINEVIFNPTWSPPPSIIRKEMIPKLRNNPDYFVRAGFTVYQDGEAVDPHNVNFDAGNDFNFRQSAGSRNALGKIKFNMPDTDDIYLHSTSNPELFAKEERSLSHGCIRLEKPRDLAHFVMDGMEGWDTQKVDADYDSSSTRHIKVAPVAVHIVYWTAWVDAQGVPHFADDIYRHDEALTAKLAPKTEEPIRVAEK